MLNSQSISRQVDARKSVRAHDDELIARTREIISASLVLLRSSMPTTFLGEARERPGEDAAPAESSDGT